MLKAKRENQMRKYLRNIAAMALAFCIATGLFATPAMALSPSVSSSISASAASFIMPNDPDFSRQWQFKAFSFMGDAFPYTRIDKAWAIIPASAQKIRVAVLDEGFDVDHADLAANINKQLAWNTHEENNNVSPEPGSKGHGTHVAGIFGAVAGNGIGIAGIANNLAEIVPIKIAYTHSNGVFGVDLTETAKGIDYAVAQGCKIINMSNGAYYGTGYHHDALDAAIKNAVNHGVMLVAAAGNGNKSDTLMPSDHDDVISVTSATQTGEKASYSDFNANKNIAAPGGGQKSGSSIGGEIYSTVPGGYGEKHGTSMAAPFVTGVLTLILAANPNLTADEATDILYQTATDLGMPGRDDIFGHGLVNAEAAVEKALEMKDNSGNNGNNGGSGGTGTGSGDNSGNGGNAGAGTGGGNSGGTGTGAVDNNGNGGNTGTGTGSGDNSGNGGNINPGTGNGGNSGNGGTGTGSVDNNGNGGNGGNAGTGTGSSGNSGNTGTGTGSGDNNGNAGNGGANTGGGNAGNNGGNSGGGNNNGGNVGNGGTNTGGGNNNGGNNGGNVGGGNNNGNNVGNNTDKDENIAPDKKPSTFKVTFKTNGGKRLKAALIKKAVISGKKYGKLPSPKRSGYKFLGWYTKKNGGTKITANTIVRSEKNHPLYAHWKRK